MRMLLLRDTVDTEDSPDEEQLQQFVLSLGGDALRDGITFDIADSDVPGVRVQIVDDEMEVDLSTDTLTALLLKHLSPRFRAAVEQQSS